MNLSEKLPGRLYLDVIEFLKKPEDYIEVGKVPEGRHITLGQYSITITESNHCYVERSAKATHAKKFTAIPNLRADERLSLSDLSAITAELHPEQGITLTSPRGVHRIASDCLD